MIRAAGIDGGGTRTRCLIADETGAILGQGEAGPANCATLTISEVAQSVISALEEACRAAACGPEAIDSVCVGLAGFYPLLHAANLASALADRLPCVPFSAETTDHRPPAADSHSAPNTQGPRPKAQGPIWTLVPDLVIAWAGGTALQPGVVVVAGTGSVAYGRNESGDAARVGGWGYLAGDEGSAYWIGRQALKVLARTLDGRSSPTLLAESLPRHDPTRSQGGEEWLRAVYREQWPPSRIAALAPSVFAAAAAGDPAASRILQRAGEHLGTLAVHVLRRLGLDRTGSLVVTAGGVLERPGPVRDALAGRLTRDAPGARLEAPRLSPTGGALLLAMERLAVRLHPRGLERLYVALSPRSPVSEPQAC
jgi:N-acetylglucosamine kinase